MVRKLFYTLLILFTPFVSSVIASFQNAEPLTNCLARGENPCFRIPRTINNQQVPLELSMQKSAKVLVESLKTTHYSEILPPMTIYTMGLFASGTKYTKAIPPKGFRDAHLNFWLKINNPRIYNPTTIAKMEHLAKFPLYLALPLRVGGFLFEYVFFKSFSGECTGISSRKLFYPLLGAHLIQFIAPTKNSISMNPLIPLILNNIGILIVKCFGNAQDQAQIIGFNQANKKILAENFHSKWMFLQHCFQIFSALYLKYGAFIPSIRPKNFLKMVFLPFVNTKYFDKRRFNLSLCFDLFLIAQSIYQMYYPPFMAEQKKLIEEGERLLALFPPQKLKMQQTFDILEDNLKRNNRSITKLYPDQWSPTEKNNLALTQKESEITMRCLYETENNSPNDFIPPNFKGKDDDDYPPIFLQKTNTMYLISACVAVSVGYLLKKLLLPKIKKTNTLTLK